MAGRAGPQRPAWVFQVLLYVEVLVPTWTCLPAAGVQPPDAVLCQPYAMNFLTAVSLCLLQLCTKWCSPGHASLERERAGGGHEPKGDELQSIIEPGSIP